MNFFYIFILTCFLVTSNLFAAYRVDLSSPPENRWTELVNQYEKKDLRQYAAMINQSIIDANSLLEIKWVREQIMSYGWNDSMDTDSVWFKDLQAEIKGLANALKKRMDGETLRGFEEEDLFLLNIGYDFSAYCTTGVYQTDEGPILFRNLDWEGDEFRKFTFEADFEKNGQPIFKSIQFLGQVGVFTGMRHDGYAVALNFRKTGSSDWEILNNLFQFTFKEGWSCSLLLRYTLEHEVDFVGAKSRLVSTELMAPCYLTLAGLHPNEGVVIERGRETMRTRDFFNAFENPKFLVQTNHDIPKPAAQDERWAGDDLLLNESMGMGTVRRREAAIAFLKKIDESNLNSQLMQMLSNYWPVYNTLTIFSSLLSPKDNHMEWVAHEAGTIPNP